MMASSSENPHEDSVAPEFFEAGPDSWKTLFSIQSSSFSSPTPTGALFSSVGVSAALLCELSNGSVTDPDSSSCSWVLLCISCSRCLCTAGVFYPGAVTSWLTRMFSFYNNFPVLFLFAPHFRHSWLRTTDIFHTPCWISFLKEIYNLLCCINEAPSRQGHVSFPTFPFSSLSTGSVSSELTPCSAHNHSQSLLWGWNLF